jgi:hypothetical protein|nr:MAG TPA: helix-turn-helix domain protein [Caudoviricetes sp.]
MKEKELDYKTVYLAVHGNKQAQEKILAYYERYINSLSTIEIEDREGNIKSYVDEDLKAEIQAGYLEAIPKCKVIK